MFHSCLTPALRYSSNSLDVNSPPLSVHKFSFVSWLRPLLYYYVDTTATLTVQVV